ncbi:unnamed protein product [Vitrella brassicaformis CCMP3155]|uniref:Uncharacterized protein n=1 Tax=Vitrella brassicaformis (strain CCMP3155) TaxID=1169540 RepID=A0A0G4EAW1_VITBC|nr:unnamed protein product [Vitrella brassicaformis CCMP3155]|eukprot:CEL92438.1 unnamed protein product [Vitrella brassicaformis CCMP3155]
MRPHFQGDLQQHAYFFDLQRRTRRMRTSEAENMENPRGVTTKGRPSRHQILPPSRQPSRPAPSPEGPIIAPAQPTSPARKVHPVQRVPPGEIRERPKLRLGQPPPEANEAAEGKWQCEANEAAEGEWQCPPIRKGQALEDYINEVFEPLAAARRQLSSVKMRGVAPPKKATSRAALKSLEPLIRPPGAMPLPPPPPLKPADPVALPEETHEETSQQARVVHVDRAVQCSPSVDRNVEGLETQLAFGSPRLVWAAGQVAARPRRDVALQVQLDNEPNSPPLLVIDDARHATVPDAALQRYPYADVQRPRIVKTSPAEWPAPTHFRPRQEHRPRELGSQVKKLPAPAAAAWLDTSAYVHPEVCNHDQSRHVRVVQDASVTADEGQREEDREALQEERIGEALREWIDRQPPHPDMQETAVQTAEPPRPQPPSAPTPPRRTSETVAIQTSTHGDDTATAIRQLAQEINACRRTEEKLRALQQHERARKDEKRPEAPSKEGRPRLKMSIPRPRRQEQEDRAHVESLAHHGQIEGVKSLNTKAAPSVAQPPRACKSRPPLPPTHPAARPRETQLRTSHRASHSLSHERSPSDEVQNGQREPFNRVPDMYSPIAEDAGGRLEAQVTSLQQLQRQAKPQPPSQGRSPANGNDFPPAPRTRTTTGFSRPTPTYMPDPTSYRFSNGYSTNKLYARAGCDSPTNPSPYCLLPYPPRDPDTSLRNEGQQQPPHRRQREGKDWSDWGFQPSEGDKYTPKDIRFMFKGHSLTVACQGLADGEPVPLDRYNPQYLNSKAFNAWLEANKGLFSSLKPQPKPVSDSERADLNALVAKYGGPSFWVSKQQQPYKESATSPTRAEPSQEPTSGPFPPPPAQLSPPQDNNVSETSNQHLPNGVRDKSRPMKDKYGTNQRYYPGLGEKPIVGRPICHFEHVRDPEWLDVKGGRDAIKRNILSQMQHEEFKREREAWERDAADFEALMEREAADWKREVEAAETAARGDHERAAESTPIPCGPMADECSEELSSCEMLRLITARTADVKARLNRLIVERHEPAQTSQQPLPKQAGSPPPPYTDPSDEPTQPPTKPSCAPKAAAKPPRHPARPQQTSRNRATPSKDNPSGSRHPSPAPKKTHSASLSTKPPLSHLRRVPPGCMAPLPSRGPNAAAKVAKKRGQSPAGPMIVVDGPKNGEKEGAQGAETNITVNYSMTAPVGEERAPEATGSTAHKDIKKIRDSLRLLKSKSLNAFRHHSPHTSTRQPSRPAPSPEGPIIAPAQRTSPARKVHPVQRVPPGEIRERPKLRLGQPPPQANGRAEGEWQSEANEVAEGKWQCPLPRKGQGLEDYINEVFEPLAAARRQLSKVKMREVATPKKATSLAV